MAIIRGLTFKCLYHRNGCLTELPKKNLARHEAEHEADFNKYYNKSISARRSDHLEDSSRLGGVLGFKICLVCKDRVDLTKPLHLCGIEKYSNLCQAHVDVLYKRPFSHVQQAKVIATLFRCFLCTDLLSKPKTCGSCGVNFCTLCISKNLKNLKRCPSCFTEKPLIKDFPAKLSTELGRLQIICSDGCGEILYYGDIE